MAETVYALCAFTAFACAVMLLRGFRRSGARVLFWASLCFVCLTLNNVLLYVDLVVVPNIDLSAWRTATALGGVGMLLFAFVWEGQR